jgi:hypothetical protein
MDVVVAYYTVLIQYFPGGAEKYHVNAVETSGLRDDIRTRDFTNTEQKF